MKKHFQKITVLTLLSFLAVGCSETSSSNNLKKELELQQKALDLKEKELKEKQFAMDSIENTKQEDAPRIEKEIAPVKDENDISGKHSLTLQWISWQSPGKVIFTQIEEDEFEIEGEQKGRKSNDECSDCYLTIKGVMKRLSPKKLQFTGRIESSIHHIQNGDPCVKEGTFDFISTGSRKYWRCQNMDGCEGVTDYVDIYFN